MGADGAYFLAAHELHSYINKTLRSKATVMILEHMEYRLQRRSRRIRTPTAAILRRNR